MDNAGAVGGPLLAALLLKFVFDDERSVFLLAAIPGVARGRRARSRKSASAPRATPGPSGAVRGSHPAPPLLDRSSRSSSLFTLASSTDAFLLLKAGDTGVPMWQIPLLWAAFNGVKAAGGVPGGALADRLGHVWTILGGWVVYALAYVGFAFAARPAQIWALFAFYALFYALTEGAERALVADLVPAASRGRAFGAFHGSVGLAALPASLLFGILVEEPWLPKSRF